VIVVDTTVVSELMRPSPSVAVTEWVRDCDDDLCTTSITVAEIRHGIERLPAGRRKDALRATADDIFTAFDEQVLPFDAHAALRYATIVAQRDQPGRPIDGFDAQIAAICRTHQAVLATRNLSDFGDTGIDVIDPWDRLDR
jgi:toxin FitB